MARAHIANIIRPLSFFLSNLMILYHTQQVKTFNLLMEIRRIFKLNFFNGFFGDSSTNALNFQCQKLLNKITF